MAARQRESLLTGRYAAIPKEIDAADAEKNSLDGVRFSKVFQQFLGWVGAHRRDRTGELYGLAANRAMKVLGDLALAQLGTTGGDRLAAVLRDRGLVPDSIDMELRHLCRFLREV